MKYWTNSFWDLKCDVSPKVVSVMVAAVAAAVAAITVVAVAPPAVVVNTSTHSWRAQ